MNTMSAAAEALLERADVRTGIRQLVEGNVAMVKLSDGLVLRWATQ